MGTFHTKPITSLDLLHNKHRHRETQSEQAAVFRVLTCETHTSCQHMLGVVLGLRRPLGNWLPFLRRECHHRPYTWGRKGSTGELPICFSQVLRTVRSSTPTSPESFWTTIVLDSPQDSCYTLNVFPKAQTLKLPQVWYDDAHSCRPSPQQR